MTKYPAQIDTSVELPLAVNNITKINAKSFNDLRSAILAVESELGVRPSASYSTVKSRLDTLETNLSNLDLIQLAGDLGGLLSSPTVIKLQGKDVSNADPNLNDSLLWNGIAWDFGKVSELYSINSVSVSGDDVSITSVDHTLVNTDGYLKVNTGSYLELNSVSYLEMNTDGYLGVNVGTQFLLDIGSLFTITAPSGIKINSGPLHFDYTSHARICPYKYDVLPDSNSDVYPGYLYSGGTSQLSGNRTYTLNTTGYTIKIGDFVIISNSDTNNTITFNYPGGNSTSIGPNVYCMLVNTNGSTAWNVVDKHAII